MTTFSIPDMSCGHCKATVEKAIKTLDPTASLDFDMAARTVDVTSVAAVDAMRAALSAAGYDTADA